MTLTTTRIILAVLALIAAGALMIVATDSSADKGPDFRCMPNAICAPVIDVCPGGGESVDVTVINEYPFVIERYELLKITCMEIASRLHTDAGRSQIQTRGERKIAEPQHPVTSKQFKATVADCLAAFPKE